MVLGGIIAELMKPVVFVMEGGYAGAEIGVKGVNVLTALDDS
jgi:acetoin utilization deacetylase AcuC-like enzyme